MVKRVTLAASLAVLLGAAGCSMAPTYQPPQSIAPVAYKQQGPWILAAPGVPAAQDWWKQFGDPDLDDLESRIGIANPSLAGAVGRYDAARAQLKQAGADLLPQVSVGAALSHNRQSDNRPLRGATQPSRYSEAEVGGGVGFDLDLWGAARNRVAAGKADAEASADDVAALKLSLESLLATSYMSLRGYDQQADLLSQTVSAYAKADAMTRNRFTAGIADGVDIGRSGAQLNEARAELEGVRNARALTENAIATLVGAPASTFSITPAEPRLRMPSVPVQLPSDLLQDRPDLAAAERRMYAANRQIGVTKAAFFPSISLGATGGFQSTEIPGLLSAPNILWSLGPGALLQLFDGGRRHAKEAEAKAHWTEATADYRGVVLKAFQEVEDNLARIDHLGKEAAAEQQAANDAGQAETLSMNRYAKGAADYLEVVTAQTTALHVRRTGIDLETRRMQAEVNLIEAMGGGWQKEGGRGAGTGQSDAMLAP